MKDNKSRKNVPEKKPDFRIFEGQKGKKQRDPKKGDKQSVFQWKRAGRTSLIWVFIIIAAVFLSSLFTNSSKKEVEIDYSIYREYLTSRILTKANIIEKTFHGELTIPQTVITDYGTFENVTRVYLTLPFIDREIMEEWDANNLEYSFKEKTAAFQFYRCLVKKRM